MSRITEESMAGENNPILDMLTQGNSVVSILDTGKSGENSGNANGEVSMNIALGMATTDSIEQGRIHGNKKHLCCHTPFGR